MNTRDIIGIFLIMIIMFLASVAENPKEGGLIISKIQKGISDTINSIIRWINKL